MAQLPATPPTALPMRALLLPQLPVGTRPGDAGGSACPVRPHAVGRWAAAAAGCTIRRGRGRVGRPHCALEPLRVTSSGGALTWPLHAPNCGWQELAVETLVDQPGSDCLH